MLKKSNAVNNPKDFLRPIIFISIISLAASSKYNIANKASILSNYHYYNKFHRRGSGVTTKATIKHPTLSSAASYRRDLRTINSWNFRSLSSLQLSAQPPPAATSSSSIHQTRRSHGIPFGLENVASVSSTTSSVHHRRRSRRTGVRFNRTNNNNHLHKDNDYDLDDDIMANQLISSRKRDLSTVSNGQGLNNGDVEYEPTLAEMRAQLGPIGLLIANAVEVGIATAGSYMSGGIFGYMVGGVAGVPALFKGPLDNGQPPFKPSSSFKMSQIQRKIGNWNSKAFAQGKSWAGLSASFSGFHALTRVCRGGVEDKWNSIIGSACAGAYLSKDGGLQAMLQGASTYATFTYILDMVFGSTGQPKSRVDKDFDFTDTPIEDRGY